MGTPLFSRSRCCLYIRKCSLCGPFLSAELLIKLRARGVRMAQVGVNHFPRAAGTNTGASIGKILRTFRDLAKLRWDLWTKRDEVLGRRG